AGVGRARARAAGPRSGPARAGAGEGATRIRIWWKARSAGRLSSAPATRAPPAPALAETGAPVDGLVSTSASVRLATQCSVVRGQARLEPPLCAVAVPDGSTAPARGEHCGSRSSRSGLARLLDDVPLRRVQSEHRQPLLQLRRAGGVGCQVSHSAGALF